MPQDIFELLWCFVVYAILGWIIEVIYAGVNKAQFVNRGFLNGPYCPIYGFGMLIVIVILYPIKENWIMLYFGSFILTTVLEYFTGLILEKVFQNKWWDYSGIPFNIQGYVCLKFSCVWGLGCMFMIDIIHPMLYEWIHGMPDVLDEILLGIILFLMLVDVCATVFDILNLNKRIKQLDDLANKMRGLSDELGEDIFEKVSLVVQKKETLQAEYDSKIKQLEILKNEFETRISDKSRGSERLIKAFPHIKSKKWGEALENYKEFIKNRNLRLK